MFPFPQSCLFSTCLSQFIHQTPIAKSKDFNFTFQNPPKRQKFQFSKKPLQPINTHQFNTNPKTQITSQTQKPRSHLKPIILTKSQKPRSHHKKKKNLQIFHQNQKIPTHTTPSKKHKNIKKKKKKSLKRRDKKGVPECI